MQISTDSKKCAASRRLCFGLVVCLSCVLHVINYSLLGNAINNNPTFEFKHSNNLSFYKLDSGDCLLNEDRISMQCMPSFSIIGTMKSGTGRLMDLLNQQDDMPTEHRHFNRLLLWEYVKFYFKTLIFPGSACISMPTLHANVNTAFVSGTGWKVKPEVRRGVTSKLVSYSREKSNEVHFFGLNYELERRKCTLQSKTAEKAHSCTLRSAGLKYLSHFETKPTLPHEHKIFFDKSPDYIRSPRKLIQMLNLLPHQKLIVALRDPEVRMYSEFQHHCRHGRYVYFKKSVRDSALRSLSMLVSDSIAESRDKLVYSAQNAILEHVTEQLRWNDTFYANPYQTLESSEGFHMQKIPYPATPTDFHHYITGTPLKILNEQYIICKIATFRDIEEIALSMMDSHDQNSGWLDSKFPGVLDTILDQWDEFHKYPNMAPKRSDLFYHDEFWKVNNKIERGDRVGSYVLMVGPSLDLAHGLVGRQLLDLDRIYNKFHCLLAAYSNENINANPMTNHGVVEYMNESTASLGVFIILNKDLELFSSSCQGKLDLKQQVRNMLDGDVKQGPNNPPKYNGNSSAVSYARLKYSSNLSTKTTNTENISKRFKYMPMKSESKQWLQEYYRNDVHLLSQFL